MKKLLTMLAMGALFTACNNEKPADDGIIQLDKPTTSQSTPCIVEVPCNDPTLKAVSRDLLRLQKFYNFCDSTVTIAGEGKSHAGPILSKRPITELLGTEKAEMENAHKKYQSILGVK